LVTDDLGSPPRAVVCVNPVWAYYRSFLIYQFHLRLVQRL
jgi:hypothetical protein